MFFERPDALKKENYVAKKPVDGSWRKRFEAVESWASSNPWDQIEKPSEKEIDMVIRRLLAKRFFLRKQIEMCEGKSK